MSRGLETHSGHIVLSSTLRLKAEVQITFKSDIWIHSGEDYPDGAAEPWLSAPIGSIYLMNDPWDFREVIWYKTEDNGHQEDWGAAFGWVMG